MTTYLIQQTTYHPALYISRNLFGQLFFAEFVEHKELPRQHNVLNESNTGEFHSNDDVTIRHHHGNCTEVDLQVFRQLLSARISWILR